MDLENGRHTLYVYMLTSLLGTYFFELRASVVASWSCHAGAKTLLLICTATHSPQGIAVSRENPRNS